jgi:hypothetical protein
MIESHWTGRRDVVMEIGVQVLYEGQTKRAVHAQHKTHK